MTRITFPIAFTLVAAACSGAGDASEAASGATAGGTTRAEPAALTVTLARATVIRAKMQDSLSSRVDKPDQRVRATVAADVKDEAGRVVIPAGSPLTLRIVKLEPGSDRVRPEGRLELAVSSVTINGKATPISASVGAIPHRLQGRGVTKDEVGRTAVGTAVGAGVGQLIGKDTKSTVIGAVVGTAAGAAVASKYAYRDVIVDRGAAFTVTLAQPVVVELRN